MEGVAVNIYRNLKVLCRRRGYKRLTVSTKRNRNKTANPNRRRFWRFKIGPKLRIVSPKKFFSKLRDGYINFMLRLAASPAVAGAGGGYGAVDFGVGGFGMRSVKEYDEKVIIEIYKSLVKTHGQLVVRDAGDGKSHLLCAP